MQNRVVSLSSQTLGVRIRVATGLKGVVVPRDGPQPVVERPAPQGQPPPPPADHAERPAVMEGDGGVEAAPAVELHVRTEAVDAGGERRGESVDGVHGVHPADEQRQPLPGHRVGSHEV